MKSTKTVLWSLPDWDSCSESEGSGFSGLKRIYVNGYETYFNNALMTDNNVWVTLNAATPVEKANVSVRNTASYSIRMITTS